MMQARWRRQPPAVPESPLGGYLWAGITRWYAAPGPFIAESGEVLLLAHVLHRGVELA
jgi:hypothetical protein